MYALCLCKRHQSEGPVPFLNYVDSKVILIAELHLQSCCFAYKNLLLFRRSRHDRYVMRFAFWGFTLIGS